MIDLHILTHEGTRQDWLEQALASTEGQSVEVHIVDNTGCSVGQGRSKGYQLGVHEYVAYLDSDDYLLPGAIEACMRGLEHHAAVVTREYIEYPNGQRYPFPRVGHALAVYRRCDVLPWIHSMEQSAHTTDARMRMLLRPLQLDFIGYVWRVHPDGDHHHVDATIFEKETPAWLSQTAPLRSDTTQ